MDQRPIKIIIVLIILLFVQWCFAQPTEDLPTVVEASPIDIFSERSGVWNSQKVTPEKTHLDISSPYETFSKIPGVQARFEGSPTVSIRGSQSLPRVLGLYNSIPLNMADGSGANRLLIPHETIDEVRLFKGPASLFFGGDAMGGAVNFLSRKLDRPTARGHVGSFGQRGLLIATPLLSTTRHQNQLSFFNESVDGNYPYTLKSSGASGTRADNNRHLQRYTYMGQNHFDRWSFGQNLVWAQEMNATPGSVITPGTTQARNTAGLASLQNGFKLSDSTEFHHRIFGIVGDNEYRDSTSESFAKTSRVGNSLSWKQDWQTSTPFNSELFVDHNHDEHKSTYSGDRVYTTDETETGVIFDIPIWDHFILKSGTRYLWAHKVAVSAAGLFEETESLKRWMTYSEGFHNPSLSQRLSNFGTSIANPELKPETSQQVEIGFQQRLIATPQTYWDQYRWGASVFRINYKNFISTRTLAGGQTQPVNLGSANGYGMELQAGLDKDLWSFDLGYSYMEAEDNDKQSLPLTPNHQASLTAGYRWATLLFEVTDTYWSKFYDRYGTGLVEMGSWNTFDLTIRTKDLNDWTVKGGVLNILDTPVELTRGYPEPQRRFFVSVEHLL
ncbi:MAG: TonB-dependent receptor [Bdellovibrionales bacterium]